MTGKTKKATEHYETNLQAKESEKQTANVISPQPRKHAVTVGYSIKKHPASFKVPGIPLSLLSFHIRVSKDATVML